MESIITHVSAPIFSVVLLIVAALALSLALVHTSQHQLRPARVAPRRAAPASRR